MTNEVDKDQEELEAHVVEMTVKARTIAQTLFGDQVNDFAENEIYKFIINPKVDEEEFAADLKRMIDHAKVAYETPNPSPERVFRLFERVFDVEED